MAPSLAAIAATRIALPAGASAQATPRRDSASAAWVTPASLGSLEEERIRLGQLLGTDSTAGYLLRSLSTATAALAEPAPRARVIGLLPELRIRTNSSLALPANDGALWAGRGLNYLLRAGAALRAGKWTVIFAPEGIVSGNGDYYVFPHVEPQRRNVVQPYWYDGRYSVDMPQRFGDESIAKLTFGQSSAFYTTAGVSVGVSAENEWWGPGMQNALLLSDAAAGFPHAFVRTARALRTVLGDVEARLILGRLTESDYFDYDSTNDHRSISGVAATLRPRGARNLTIGVSRLVIAPVSGGVAGHALDALTVWETLGAPADSLAPLEHDQLLEVFGRYVVPSVGVELYAEYARSEAPRSLRELLVAPQNTRAYTVGFAHAAKLGRGDALRTSIELTNLEQSIVFTDRATPPDFYTGRAAPQGFTERGQMLGAAIGPGSSAQRVAFDYYAPRWQTGLFVSRVRWQNDAVYRQYLTGPWRHDVSWEVGVRSAVRLPYADARLEIANGARDNYLFQTGYSPDVDARPLDYRTFRLAIDLAPRARSAGGGAPRAAPAR